MNEHEGAPQQAPAPEAPIDEIERVRQFWTQYGKTVITVVVGAFLAGLVLTGLGARSRAHRQRAGALLDAAKTPADLESLIEKYPSADVAPVAMLRLAKEHFDAGNYDMALNKYDEFLLKHRDTIMGEIAELGRLHCVEAKGDWATALAGFTDYQAAHTNQLVSLQAFLGQGRCLESLGRHTEARTLYEDFIAAHPEDRVSQTLEERLSIVKRAEARGQAAPAATSSVPVRVEAPPTGSVSTNS